jgi:flagellar hook protein FlgE
MTFNIALTGLQAASSQLTVIGNNIANASTSGFKQSKAHFADVYAASNLGSGGNTIGSGVLLSSVEQEFSQGQIQFTKSNLDLAVNGRGFFVLNNNGSVSYTRAGSFGVDKNGYISTALGGNLEGYLSDDAGKITGARGNLQITNSSLAPKSTEDVTISVNLDATISPPAAPFVSGFTSTNPPDPSTFNTSTSTTVYDSLGNSHIMTSYFVKSHEENTWKVHVAVDGTDATPTSTTPPVGVPPQAYPQGSIPSPFTLKFSPTGAFIPNSPAQPPLYYGPGPVTSTDLALGESANLPTVEVNELTINGVSIPATVDSNDIYSTTGARGSAISIAAAINSQTALHGVTASVNPTSVNMGTPTFGNLAAGDFVINGINVTGAVANDAQLLTAINNETGLTGVVATQPGGAGTAIILTAADGRNIQVETSGTVGSIANFSGFDLHLGAADPLNNQVKRATYNLTTVNDLGITVAGTASTDAGLTSGPKSGIVQNTSDVIKITTWSPGGGAQGPQELDINFGDSSQFGAPFSVQALSQNGYSTGRLSGVEVDPSGIIFARYSNGQSKALGQVALANFGSVQSLNPHGDTTWVETYSSGPALVGAPGTADLGLVQSGALEDSNVNLTDELVSLILAQRNFQANAQTIRTADATTQAIINLR